MVKQEKLKLTVVLKTKNSQDFLYEVLESIKLAQEIIILDNHSTDDSVEIAKEYKAKVIFSDNADFSLALGLLKEEISNDWVLILEENEILPLALFKKIEAFIKNPPKNCALATFPIKTFYLNQEIKSFYEKNALRLFKKDFAQFKNNFSLEIEKRKPKKGEKIKIYNFKSSGKKEENILKFKEHDVAKNFSAIIEKNRNILKNEKFKKASTFFFPFLQFFKYYIFKKGFLEGRKGFIFASEKFFEAFILNVMILEKNFKGDKYDI